MIRVVFMGTPEFSVPVLQGLIESDKYDVVGVVSQPDKKTGRKMILTKSPISTFAIEHNIPLFRIEKIKTDYSDILELNPDIIITCAYGQIIPKVILDYPKYGCINVHASLLPKYRGASPIHHALINGEDKTGITIMYMDEKMDTGDIISQKEIKIEQDDNLDSLSEKLSILGKELLLNTLDDIIDNNVSRKKQNEAEATYTHLIKRDDEHIDFSKNAKDVLNLVRGLSSKPGAFALLDNKVFKIYRGYIGEKATIEPGTITKIYKDGIGVSTNDKEYVITELQESGKKKVTAKEYLNGKNEKDLIGKIFR